jgi:uncharacterized protein with von Willebrand factor type A (vWA) domain
MAEREVEENTALDDDKEYMLMSQAVKLIPRQFKGRSRKLREFIEGAEAAIESTSPENRELVLELIVDKIPGDVKEEQFTRVEGNTWPQIKDILEENYLTERILEKYTSTLFNFRQGFRRTIAQWKSWLDMVAKDLGREVKQKLSVLTASERGYYLEGGLELTNKFLKGMFVVGFKDERVKVVVRTKERRERSMVQLVEAAIQK